MLGVFFNFLSTVNLFFLYSDTRRGFKVQVSCFEIRVTNLIVYGKLVFEGR